MNEARNQAYHGLHRHWYEFPDAHALEVWCYTGQLSYKAGDSIDFHISTTASEYEIEILRDGVNPQRVYHASKLPGKFQETPREASVKGCGWEVTHRWQSDANLASGAYLVRCRVEDNEGQQSEHKHLFVLRPHDTAPKKDMLFLLGTSTWTAYNDWGGSNHYEGNCEGEDVNVMSPVLSTQRPWAKGQIWLPVGAPRIPIELPPDMGAIPRYPPLEWACLHGYSKYFCASGWASFERHFACWAEPQGYAMDYATQTDIHETPEMLEDYRCVVIVGHDEYWSAEMRDAIDRFVDQGGNVARFGANFIWQIRLSENTTEQTCYKYYAQERDPVMGTEQQRSLSTAWESPLVGRPGASTFGLNGFHCVYSGFGGWNPRNSGGYTVYRNKHWVFEGTDLYFGDTFGMQAKVFGYEVDGVDFTFKNGLPYPTFSDGAPETLEILAMNASGLEEEDHGNEGAVLYAGDADVAFKVQELEGQDTPELREKHQYGAGQMAVFTRNGGTVFNAGSCEWVNGLRLRDPFTEKITQNVLKRFTSR
jgi:hypothetical protein